MRGPPKLMKGEDVTEPRGGADFADFAGLRRRCQGAGAED